MSKESAKPGTNDLLQTLSPELVQALADGMHALAQPLGILQGKLELVLLDKSTAEGRQATVEECLESVESASGLLSYLQQLLALCRHRSEPGPVETSKVLLSVVTDLKLVLEESGVELDCRFPEDLPIVFAAKARIREALFYALQAAHALAKRGQRVTISALAVEADVQIAFENTECWVTSECLAASAARRKLTLANMIVRSQQGEFSWDGEPFSIRMLLPVSVPVKSVL